MLRYGLLRYNQYWCNIFFLFWITFIHLIRKRFELYLVLPLLGLCSPFFYFSARAILLHDSAGVRTSTPYTPNANCLVPKKKISKGPTRGERHIRARVPGLGIFRNFQEFRAMLSPIRFFLHS